MAYPLSTYVFYKEEFDTHFKNHELLREFQYTIGCILNMSF